MEQKRFAGILLHITSLPSKYGVGTLGKEAFEFIDFLKSSNISLWQVLPLVPTNYGDSPYQSVSSTALNYYLIDFDTLRQKKLLKKEDYENVFFGDNPLKVDYAALFNNKVTVLKKAFSNFDKENKNFKKFVKDGDYHDFAIFMTIKSLCDYKAWDLWPEEFKNYSLELEERVVKEYNDDYLFWVWTQYEFILEWKKLKAYAKENGISIMGDMPIYVAYDSVEVWKHPELFDLNPDKTRHLVAGCPPDVFSADGQLWGNPCYNWKLMKERGYKWWTYRINENFKFVDYLRIDHFRGFDRYYAIPAENDTARFGEWLDGPKSDLFKDKLDLNIVAEDLGVIDDGVRKLMADTNYPGMKILEFAFDGSLDNDHLPSNYKKNLLCYTGTHDNMPLYQYILDLNEKEFEAFKEGVIREAKGLNVPVSGLDAKGLEQTVVELAFASIANIAIIPLQDLLCQDGSTRMNLPSTVSTKNWSYRCKKEYFSDELAARLRDLVNKYHR